MISKFGEATIWKGYNGIMLIISYDDKFSCYFMWESYSIGDTIKNQLSVEDNEFFLGTILVFMSPFLMQAKFT